MRHREGRGQRRVGRRGWAALPVMLALVAALLPATRAQQTNAGGRPRRVTTNNATTTQQPAPTPTPSRTATTRTTQTTGTPAPQRTPAPGQTPQTTPAPSTAGPQLKTTPSGRVEEPASQQQDQEVGEDEVVRVESNLVNLHVRVVDRNNRTVNDVRKEDFRVLENGVPQNVQFVTQEEVPISYGLVVDNSGSLRNQIGQVIDAGKTIINSNKTGDETFVVRFVSSEDIEIKQDFTADKNALTDALDDMVIEGGQTAIIDAVFLSAEHAAERRKGNPVEDKRRRALILVTDGEDRASFYKQEQLFENLKEQDVQIYVIGFVNELDKERGFISKSKRERATELLNRLAKETGGRAFFPTSLSELPGIAQEITKDLRTQYVLSYTPTTKARPGEFRPVRVTVADVPGRDKRIAITRTGYTGRNDNAAPPPDRPSPATSRRP